MKKRIKSKKTWYHKWHAHPYHGHVHWFVFVLAAFAVYYIMNSRVLAAIDTIPPVVSITYPTAKSVVTSGSTITVSASATDNIGIAGVYIFVSREDKPNVKGSRQGNSNSIVLTRVKECTLTTAPYICVWNVPSGQNVTYLTQAIATDSAGNKTISKYVNFLAR